MDKAELTIWIIAGVLMGVWLIGFLQEAGIWIHALLIAAVMLGVFAILQKRSEAKAVK